MLSLVGKKFYLFWSLLLLVFPVLIHLVWLRAVVTTDTSAEAVDRFVGYFPIFFQYRTLIGFLSLFLSTLSFMFSLRLTKGMDKYSIPGIFILIISFYLVVINLWNLI